MLCSAQHTFCSPWWISHAVVSGTMHVCIFGLKRKLSRYPYSVIRQSYITNICICFTKTIACIPTVSVKPFQLMVFLNSGICIIWVFHSFERLWLLLIPKKVNSNLILGSAEWNCYHNITNCSKFKNNAIFFSCFTKSNKKKSLSRYIIVKTMVSELVTNDMVVYTIALLL